MASTSPTKRNIANDPMPLKKRKVDNKASEGTDDSDSDDESAYSDNYSAGNGSRSQPTARDRSSTRSVTNDQRWDEMHNLLVEHGHQFNTCRIPLSHKCYNSAGMEVKLGLWLGTQRQLHRKNKLDPHKFDRLQLLVDQGLLDWGEKKMTTDEARWESMWEHLQEFVRNFGHANIPERYVINTDEGDVKLGRWLDRQRGHIKQGKMRSDRLPKFQELMERGVLIKDTVEEDERKWLAYYDALVSFLSENITATIPHNYEVQLPNGTSGKLGVWLSTQRHLHKKGNKLRQDRAEKLQKLVDCGYLCWGDNVASNDHRWNSFFDALMLYEKHFKTTMVPFNYDSCFPDGKKMNLYKWVQRQRTSYKSGALKGERLEKLQALVNAGRFSWEGISELGKKGLVYHAAPHPSPQGKSVEAENDSNTDDD